MTTWEMFEELHEILGAENLLYDLARALDRDELRVNLDYIARVNDIDLDEDE